MDKVVKADLVPRAVLDSHIGILGKTGSGKTNTAKVVLEPLLEAGERVCIIDPTDAWWGLRSNAAGDGPAYPVAVLGGAHGDLALEGAHGAVIAEVIGKTATPAVLSTRAMTVSSRTRFFTDFAEALLRTNRGPLHLVIDEAHLFMPQGGAKVGGGAPAMLHAGNNLVSLGRSAGLRITLISQRPAKLHKDALTQVETLIAMRLIAPQDRNAIDDWIGEWADPTEGRDMIASLPSMQTGHAIVWAPELGFLKTVRFPLAQTFDSSKAPSSGGRAKPVLAPIDMDALKGRLSDIAKEAVANDPAALKRRISDLERQLKVQPQKIDTDALQKAAYRDGYEAGYADGFDIALENAAAQIGKLRPCRPKAKLPEALEALTQLAPTTSAVVRETSFAPRIDSDLTPAKKRILVALRQLAAIGQNPADKTAVAWFAGASPKSSGFANNLGSLRTAGLIEYPGQGTVALTADGAAIVPAVPALDHDGLMALVAEKLSPALRRMLQTAVEAYPNEIDLAGLAGGCDASPNSSGFANNRGRLRSLGLITYPQPGTVRAADLLFP